MTMAGIGIIDIAADKKAMYAEIKSKNVGQQNYDG